MEESTKKAVPLGLEKMSKIQKIREIRAKHALKVQARKLGLVVGPSSKGETTAAAAAFDDRTAQIQMVYKGNVDAYAVASLARNLPALKALLEKSTERRDKTATAFVQLPNEGSVDGGVEVRKNDTERSIRDSRLGGNDSRPAKDSAAKIANSAVKIPDSGLKNDFDLIVGSGPKINSGSKNDDPIPNNDAGLKINSRLETKPGLQSTQPKVRIEERNRYFYNEADDTWIKYTEEWEVEEIEKYRVRAVRKKDKPVEKAETNGKLRGKCTKDCEEKFPVRVAMVCPNGVENVQVLEKLPDKVRVAIYKRNNPVLSSNDVEHLQKFGKLPFRGNPRPNHHRF